MLNHGEDRGNRDKIYAVIQGHDLAESVALYDEFKASEPLMIEAAQAETEMRIAEKRKANLGSYIGIAGLIIGILGLLFAWQSNNKAPSGPNASSNVETQAKP